MLKLFFAVLCIVAASSAVNATLSPIVNTLYGPVQGLFEENTLGAYSFKGIPYAAPPVGNLRFAAPVPPSPWTSVFNATQFGAGCLGPCNNRSFPRPEVSCAKTQSEDCLFLNIYTPTLNSSANLDVIVFYHGGNFRAGAGGVPLYDGSDFAVTQNIVVVTINYRLGVFGGLYTGRIGGNFMLQDQRRALEWIQENIAQFGGNTKSVTISGQSAGAASISYLMASNWSKPGVLYHKAFSLSNPLGLMALTPQLAMELGNGILKGVNCPESGSDEQIACLRALPAETLLAAQIAHPLAPVPGQMQSILMSWCPVVDGVIVPNQPYTAFVTGQFNRNIPYLATTVANESVQFLYDLSPEPMTRFAMEALVALVMDNITLFEDVINFYNPPKGLPDYRLWISPMVTGYLFYCPWRQVGRAMTAVGSPVYEWVYDALPDWNKWLFEASMPYCVDHTCHASDLGLYFYPLNALRQTAQADGFTPPPVPSAATIVMVRQYQTAVANFMKTGNPNTPKPLPVHFSVMNQNAKQVNISKPFSVLDNYQFPAGECDFWDAHGYRRF